MRQANKNYDPTRWRMLWRRTKDKNGNTDTSLGAPAGAVALALIAAMNGHPIHDQLVTGLRHFLDLVGSVLPGVRPH
jgi:Flp pilus assembly pilin Flp